MGVFLLIIGILALAGGGIGYIDVNGKLNDPDFWWRYYGGSTYTSAVNARDYCIYASAIGALLILVAVIIIIAKAAKKNAPASQSGPKPVQPPVSRSAAAQPLLCPRCQASYTLEQHFCRKCGLDLTAIEPEVRKCVCGYELEDDDIFCPRCGRRYE